MSGRRISVVFRAVRVKRGLRQRDVAARSSLSPSVVARHEQGHIEAASLRNLQRHAEALDLKLDLVIRGDSAPSLRDDEHAATVDHMKRRLEGIGWEVIAETSFSEYGERGRIDLLAWYPGSRTLLVIEVKTVLIDVQDVLGALDVKERLAAKIGGPRGWRPQRVASMLILTDTDANRGQVRRLPSLFARFRLRGQSASAWLSDPGTSAHLLLFVAAASVGRRRWHNGRQRVRQSPSPARR